MTADVDRTYRLLLRAVEQRGLPTSADGRVSEAAAAELLGKRPSTLTAWRTRRVGPVWTRTGVNPGGRVSYRLEDMATWLAGQQANLDQP